MSTSGDLHALRRRLYQCTELRAEAIDEPDRRRWLVDVYADEDDPVLEIIEKITWCEEGATAVGLAGGPGVGKTTQMYRLIEELWAKNSIVGIRIGYEDYSSLSSPPDITDFLLSISGGLAEEARHLGHLPDDWNAEKLQNKMVSILKRLRFEPEITTGPFKIATSLREDDSFRRRLRDHLAGQVAQLVEEVRLFTHAIVEDIVRHKPGCSGVVMIVDSTERLSSPASTEIEMQSAIRNLFIQNGENLLFEDLHSIYLLPAWLPVTDGGALRLDVVVFPTVRVECRDGTDEERGLSLLDDIVRKRMRDVESLIGAEDLHELYRMSGGVQRILFILLKEVAGRARRAISLPVDGAIVRTSLDSVRQDYLAISMEAASALRSIDQTKSVDGLPKDDLEQLGRYFQALVVLQVANGEKWFTIHPLMRKRLDAVTVAPN